MSWYPQTPGSSLYHRIPKVELHRHLEGTWRLETLKDIAHQYKLSLPEPFQQLVQVQPGDPFTVGNFLRKFQVLRRFYRSPEVIERLTYEAIEDAAADHIRYLELRFTPVALTRAEGFALKDAVEWVVCSAQQASRHFGMITRLIASVNRHESVALAEETAELAKRYLDRGIVALDLAGNEADFSARPFLDVFHRAQKTGLRLSVHAGEWGGVENVREALDVLHADRICHGVRIMDDPDLVKKAAECHIPFEVCLTSNLQSGVVSSLADHPLPAMLAAGLNITLNTDDPGIEQITLSDEYCQAVEQVGLARPILFERILAAAQAAFLPDGEKVQLVNELSKGIESILKDSLS